MASPLFHLIEIDTTEQELRDGSSWYGRWRYKRIRKRNKALIQLFILSIAILTPIYSGSSTECFYPPHDAMFNMVDVVSKDVKSVLQYNDKVHAICKDTYYDIGEISFACDGQNTYRYPQRWCREAYCPSPEAPSHGQISPPAMSYPAKAQVNITCDEGYRYSGNPTITCQRNREWDEVVGTCIKIECPAVRRPHSTLQTQPPYYYNASLPVRCKEGHYYTGDESATCGHDSQWTRPIGFCKRVTCTWPHISIDNGYIHKCRPCHYRDQLQISCDEGYKYTDPPIMCGQDGFWNITRIGSCQPVDCANLPYIKYGFVRRVNASSANVSCLESTYFKLQGPDTVRCAENGTWSTMPTCEHIHPISEGHHIATSDLLFGFAIPGMIAIGIALILWRWLNCRRNTNTSSLVGNSEMVNPHNTLDNESNASAVLITSPTPDQRRSRLDTAG